MAESENSMVEHATEAVLKMMWELGFDADEDEAREVARVAVASVLNNWRYEPKPSHTTPDGP